MRRLFRSWLAAANPLTLQALLQAMALLSLQLLALRWLYQRKLFLRL
jgi:hypothetical protein